MKKISLISLLLVFVGCTRPQVVVDAGKERDEAIKQYVANVEMRERFLIEKIHQAETQVIDAKLYHELTLIEGKYSDYLKSKTDANGKIDLTIVLEANDVKSKNSEEEKTKAAELREKAISVRDLLIAAGEKNKVNLIIANKLNDIIKGFDGAEVEAGLAAQKALEELKAILEKVNTNK